MDRAPDGTESQRCIQLGGENPFGPATPTSWCDTAHLNTRNEGFAKFLADQVAAPISAGFDIRIDMAHDPEIDRLARTGSSTLYRDFFDHIDQAGVVAERPEIIRRAGPLNARTQVAVAAEVTIPWMPAENGNPGFNVLESLIAQGVHPYDPLGHTLLSQELWETDHNGQERIKQAKCDPMLLLLRQLGEPDHVHGEPRHGNIYKEPVIVYTRSHDDNVNHDPMIAAQQMIALLFVGPKFILCPTGMRENQRFRHGAQWRLSFEANTVKRLKAIQANPRFYQFARRALALPNWRIWHEGTDRTPVFLGENPHERLPVAVRTVELALPNEPREKDRAIVVLDHRGKNAGTLHLDLCESFDISPKEISQYQLVNLITGRKDDARPIFELNGSDLPYDGHVFALQPRSHIDTLVTRFPSVQRDLD